MDKTPDKEIEQETLEYLENNTEPIYKDATMNAAYWRGLKTGYIAGRSKGLERERELEEENADLKRQLEKYETNRYDNDEDDYDPDQDRDDPRNNQTFGGKY